MVLGLLTVCEELCPHTGTRAAGCGGVAVRVLDVPHAVIQWSIDVNNVLVLYIVLNWSESLAGTAGLSIGGT